MSETIDQAVSVTLTIGIDTIVASAPDYDDDGDYCGGRNVTLGELVAVRLAAMLVKDAKAKVDYADIRQNVDASIRAAVDAKLADFTEREIIPTDAFGHRRGEPRTIAEEIVAAAEKWCDSPSGDYNSRSTKLQKLIRDEIDRKFTSELNAAIKEAKAEVTARVREHAAQLLAETLTAAGGGK